MKRKNYEISKRGKLPFFESDIVKDAVRKRFL